MGFHFRDESWKYFQLYKCDKEAFFWSADLPEVFGRPVVVLWFNIKNIKVSTIYFEPNIRHVLAAWLFQLIQTL